MKKLEIELRAKGNYLRSFWSFCSIALLLMTLSSCITTSLNHSQDFSARELGSAEDFSMKDLRSEALYSEDSREISSLYAALLNGPVEGKDLRRVNVLLAKDQRSPLEEAILAINLLQNFIQSHEDLKKNEEPSFEVPFKEEKMVSLAELSALYDLDLVDLIENNRFLQSVEVYHLLLKLRSFHSNDQVNRMLHSSIDSKFNYFKEFVRLSESVLDSKRDSDDALDRKKKKEALRPKGEKLLEKAEELLGANRYHDALLLLKEVESQDEMYALAQRKLFEVTKKAVEDLRRKAALAYQNANHIDTDYKAREEYLLKAKSLLERAIEFYPDSDELDRVRMNLKVIEDNLAFLKKGRLKKR